MNVETLSALLRPRSLKDRITDAAVLILDVDGTLAETDGIHRRAFNAAFIEAGLDWYWDQRTYKRLLRTTGGKERIQAFGPAFPGSACPILMSQRCIGSRRSTTAG